MNRMHKRRAPALLAPAVVLCLAAHGLPALAAPLMPVLTRPAEQTALATRAVLVAVTRAGARVVTVGERGIVLLSDDSGKTWRQARVPVSVTLTSVAFPSPKQGWAAGHAGVILHTDDGGETWAVQLDGKRAQAQLLEEASQAGGPLAATARSLASPEPDKPFLGLYFKDEHTGYAYGAYGMLFRTSDGGKTWSSCFTRADNPKGLHLYAMGGDHQHLYLAGEQGLLLRAGTDGEHFEPVDTGYRGSYFAVANTAGQWLLAGLKGALMRSRDGRTFEPVAGLPPVSWSSVTPVGPKVLLVNQAGMAFSFDAAKGEVKPVPTPPRFPLQALASAPDGSLVGVGLRGIARIAGNP